MHLDRLSNWVMRAGLAFAFLYPPLNALFDPTSWFGYFPEFMRGLAPEAVLLHGFGLVEVVLALWILSGKKIFIPSVVAAGMLLLIVVFHFSNFQVVFRDLSIAALAVALALDAWKRDHAAAR